MKMNESTPSAPPLARDLEIIQLSCNNFENKLTEDLRLIDSKQAHLQKRINELEKVFSIASIAARAQQQCTDFDGEQTCLKLNEKVRITGSNSCLNSEINPFTIVGNGAGAETSFHSTKCLSLRELSTSLQQNARTP